MTVSLIDWAIIAAMVAGIFGLALYSKRYMRSVADFLAANRVAGRYLLTVSNTFFGAIWLVALWEMTFSTGLPPQWWTMMNLPVGLFLALTGFIIYRFRQTRALTLAQFFEERYSRGFRFFSAILCWTSGILNYGIFPAITARLLVYFLRLPVEFELLGVTVPTVPVMMAAYLSLAVFIAVSGGQIAIMITDFLQGSLLMIIFVVVTVFFMGRFEWSDIMAGLEVGVAENVSLISPAAESATSDFNIFYFLIGLMGLIYNARSWQGNSGYNSAARTPHEAVIAAVVSNWRGLVSGVCVAVLIPIVAYAVLHLPQFADLAAPIQAQLEAIPDLQIRSQMTVPIALSNLLPVGLFGLFAAVIIGTAISFDDTYLHSWGSIFIQDVVTPLRGKPFQPETHLRLLRWAIVGVALFAFVFSCLFDLKTYVLQYFALTGAIYLGGAGAVIIGGLYWKRGTTRAAYVAMTVGSILGISVIALEQSWKYWMQSVVAVGTGESAYTLPADLLAVLGGLVFILLLAAGAYLWRRHRRAAAACLLAGTAIGLGCFALWHNWETLCRAIMASETWSGRVFANLEKFPVNGQWTYFIAMAAASILYVVISLAKPDPQPFNLDKLLHRGCYAVKSDAVAEVDPEPRNFLQKLLGITANFSRFERWLFYISFAWTIGWWLFFLGVTAVFTWFPSWLPGSFWPDYWQVYVWINAGLGTLCTVWIFSGGLRDAIRMFRALKQQKVDDADDGFMRNDEDEE